MPLAGGDPTPLLEEMVRLPTSAESDRLEFESVVRTDTGDVRKDLSLQEELRRRFGTRGDFARAYVIANEVGHHVQ